jgi:hypothetical protein
MRAADPFYCNVTVLLQRVQQLERLNGIETALIQDLEHRAAPVDQS